ncbi:tetratricopeptide repeat protein [Candidatus Poribacteria bacterium]|nr:tetratricopeptide repeat protein [Candidatus Poribacteria bacterium]MYI93890.1 tetratricopeptide repeat protein [Candidatus Poribacteria bacterium]
MKENNKANKTQNDENGVDAVISNSDENSVDPVATSPSIQQQFNELKSQYLSERSNSMNRLLMFIGIVLLFFTILIPIGTGIAAYFVYQKYSELQSQLVTQVNETKRHASEAEKSANDAKKYASEITAYQKTIRGIISKLTSKDFKNPDKIEILKTSYQDLLKMSTLTAEDRAIMEAYELQNEGKYTEAIAKWQSIVNAKDVNPELIAHAFFSIGFLHTEQQENDQAISAYTQAITLYPEFSEAFNSRGLLKTILEDYDAAILDFDEAIRLKPDFAEAWYNRANAKRTLKNHEDAIADYDEAIRLSPDFAGVYHYRGVSKRALGQHQEAIADFDEAIRLRPDYTDAYVNRGSAKRAIGMPGEAKKDFDKAQELSKQQ